MWVNGRSPESVDAACGRLAAEIGNPERRVPAPADIGSETSVRALFARLAKDAGRLDVLVNNAVDQAIGMSFLDTTRARLEAAFAVNVFGWSITRFWKGSRGTAITLRGAHSATARGCSATSRGNAWRSTASPTRCRSVT